VHNSSIGEDCLVEHTKDFIGSEVPEVLSQDCDLGIAIIRTANGVNTVDYRHLVVQVLNWFRIDLCLQGYGEIPIARHVCWR
jgi:hypothetical protein